MLSITQVCVYFLLLTTIFSKPLKFEPTAECMLSMRAHGLKYIQLTETMQLNLTFESNCKDYLHHAYFVIPFSKVYPLTHVHHPRTVILKLAGQEFALTYFSPTSNSRKIYFIKKQIIYTK